MFFVQVRPLLSPSWLMSSETALRHRGCKMWKYRGSQLLDATAELARKKCSVIALVAWCGTLLWLPAWFAMPWLLYVGYLAFNEYCSWQVEKQGDPAGPTDHSAGEGTKDSHHFTFDAAGICWGAGCFCCTPMRPNRASSLPTAEVLVTGTVVTTNGEGKTEPRWWQAQLDAWVRGALWRVLPRARGKTHQNCIKAVIFNLTSGIPRPDGKLR